MTLFCITYPEKNRNILRYLREACDKRKIDFKIISPDEFDYTAPPEIAPGDLVYRVSISSDAMSVENFLLREDTITFYSNFDRALSTYAYYHYDFSVHAKAGLPIPKTIYHLPKNRDLLRRAVDYLGGFPVIVKVLGASHGVGVMKVDTYSSLFSMVDFLRRHKQDAVIRQYIDVVKSARLVVLGDKVIDSIEYTAPEGDFRSNAGHKPNVAVKEFSEEIRETAVRAVAECKVEFGGVDILVDKAENIYLAEVNFPCNFARAQALTGVDIAGLMLDYLLGKRD
ncbi:MAG: hypothetical protein U1C49_00365 [Candidatus Andersenbacteria bacterium]|nr:hypothetical protein [bacterium]MDZ4225278.1 hypothetical protein [Candidatus Andersenbacteria bacterium]